MRIVIINGPNLNLLGTREPEVYGTTSFEQYFEKMKTVYTGIDCLHFQSNVEGEIINLLHEWNGKADGIILNAAGYSHTSVSIADAISAIATPVIEVHISNIYKREDYRHVSLTGSRCVGVISGLGLRGYDLALDYFLHKK